MFSKTKKYKNLQFNLQIMQMCVMRMGAKRVSETIS